MAGSPARAGPRASHSAASAALCSAWADPRGRGTVTTMLGALSIDGVDAIITVESGTTAAITLRDSAGWFKHCNVLMAQPA